MVDPAPNLRKLIVDAIYERDSGVYVDDLSDAVLAVLKRHPQAVLNLLGNVAEIPPLLGDPPSHYAVFVVSLGAAAKEANDMNNNEGKATT